MFSTWNPRIFSNEYDNAYFEYDLFQIEKQAFPFFFFGALESIVLEEMCFEIYIN